jgi:hypothetical protein
MQLRQISKRIGKAGLTVIGPLYYYVKNINDIGVGLKALRSGDASLEHALQVCKRFPQLVYCVCHFIRAKLVRRNRQGGCDHWGHSPMRNPQFIGEVSSIHESRDSRSGQVIGKQYLSMGTPDNSVHPSRPPARCENIGPDNELSGVTVLSCHHVNRHTKRGEGADCLTPARIKLSPWHKNVRGDHNQAGCREQEKLPKSILHLAPQQIVEKA